MPIDLNNRDDGRFWEHLTVPLDECQACSFNKGKDSLGMIRCTRHGCTVLVLVMPQRFTGELYVICNR